MDFHEKITVYSPESGLRRPGKLVRDMLSDFRNSLELGWRLFIRNFKGMYRQSLLGFVWALVTPVISTLVWVFLNGQRIINIEDPGVPYPAFVLTSTLLWSVFAQSLVMPINTMQTGKSIMVKINFPKESLLISGLFQIGFDFLVKLVLIVAVFIFYGVQPAITLPLACIGVVALAFGGIALGLLLLPVGMLYNDVQKLLVAVTPFWMLLTPVIYPTPREGLATLLNKFNPVSPLLTVTRDWMFFGETDFLYPFVVISGVALLLLLFGLLLFRLSVPFIIERSGS